MAQTTRDSPHILLINPWIDDFAAYDFWAKPLGLLTLGAIFRARGYQVTYVDCLDRFDPGRSCFDPGRDCFDPGRGRAPRAGRFGTGHYWKRQLPKPERLQDVPRTYSRYGLPEALVRRAVGKGPRPSAILVTSLMTYWYPGVFATIELLRELLPDVPVILGGIYATLCHEHATRFSGADLVLAGEGEAAVVRRIDQLVGFSGNGAAIGEDLDTYPYPALDLQTARAYVPLLTGRGCPFRCAYCACAFLSPSVRRRSPSGVVEEIAHWHGRYGIVDFAFYDDALLIDPETHVMPILEGVIKRGLKLRFHTPNALHIRPLSSELARLLRRAGFETIRLGLETAVSNGREALDSKVGPEEFQQAARYLHQAGFSRDNLGAYLLFGLPGQDWAGLEASIDIVKACGMRPILAQYSPIPHTAMWEKAKKASRYDLAADPLYHNNSILPCQKEPFSWAPIARLKRLAQ